MIMKVLALSLVLTSLVSAGFFTPSKDDTSKVHIEGHGAVKVEFDKQNGNTKVSVSPQDRDHDVDEKGYVESATEKVSETMGQAQEKIKDVSSYVLPEVRKGDGDQEEQVHPRFSPRELVCDAYGKCKHKIARAMEKTKDAVADKVYGLEEGAKEAAGEAFGGVKDTIAHSAEVGADKAHEAAEMVKDKIVGTAHKASDKAYEARESVEGKVAEMAKKASEAKGSVKDAASEAQNKAKGKVGEKVGDVREGAERARQQAYDVREKAREQAQELAGRASGRAKHGASRVRTFLSPLVTGLLHLMGFAVAYGMCVWVTFGSSYVLGGALPRQQFGIVQSKMYPVYLRAMAASVGMCLLGQLMSGKRSLSPLLSSTTALVMILVDMLYMEPRATKVMFERMKKEKEEGSREEEGVRISEPSKGAEPTTEQTTTTSATATGAEQAAAATTKQGAPEEATAKSRRITRRPSDILKRLNSYSSILNVVTLMSLTWHLVHLARHLHTTVC